MLKVDDVATTLEVPVMSTLTKESSCFLLYLTCALVAHRFKCPGAVSVMFELPVV